MSTQSRQSRTVSELRWQCRRGILELDLYLNAFLENVYDTLSATEQDHFRLLLEAADQHLYEWLIGQTQAPSPELQALVNRIRASVPVAI